jgi:tRNA nucleotidyltransferase/poly(A) polymerase
MLLGKTASRQIFHRIQYTIPFLLLQGRVMKRDLATATERSPSEGPRTAKRTKTAVMAQVQLNEDEQRLRRLLLGAADSIDREGKEPVVLRWAGGWVRDKLLGTQSNDIDVAINVMTGADFITYLKEYLSDARVIERHQLKEDEVGKVYNVAANPEKSKHLETASVKIFGLDLDFVNLRREVYSDISRNPTMEFGTIEEDAERRDATINALFYNLATDMVEDYVGGLTDLRNGIIRTPTEPLQTFTDDPLRVLRLVRFASRLQFEIANDTKLFMGNAGVLDSLRVKISRERVGIELEKMLRGWFGAHRRSAHAS